MQKFEHPSLGNETVFSEAESMEALRERMNEVTMDMEDKGFSETGSVIFNGKIPKKLRKLMKGGNEQVRYSMKNGEEIGDYVGANPVYVNKAKPHEPAEFVKVKAGVPFVKPVLHNLDN